MGSKLVSALLCLMLCLSVRVLPVHADSFSEAKRLTDGILGCQLQQSEAASVQEWIDGALTEQAGMTSEWYVLALCRSGNEYDFSGYAAALGQYLEQNEVTSAASREKYALVLHEVGSQSPYIARTMEDAIGQQGIMSWVFGLQLLQRGCTGGNFTEEEIVDIILDLQLEDGGWAVSGNVSDADVTAMTLQALAPYYSGNADRMDAALARLSAMQLEDGDYASYGVPNPESTAQVLAALAELGIDGLTDARFIKNGHTLLDGMAKYRLPDGSFSHTFEGESNRNATVQVFYALTVWNTLQEAEDVSVPTAETEGAPPEKTAVGYRLPVTLALAGAGGAVCLVLFLVRKRHPKNFIAVLIVTAAGIAFVWLTDFRSAQEYYSGETASVEDAAGTVTLTIRCDSVLGKSDADYIPEDGVILETTEFAFAEGDTVFDILTAAAQSHSIQMEYSGTPEMAYVSGIGYLYEFDFGDLSGWVYHVNGASHSVGCGEYAVADGDVIEWLYSCNLGEDVK